MKRTYYVYLLIDSKSSIPFYAGKGNGDRMKKHRYDSFSKSKIDGSWIHNKPHHQYIRNLYKRGNEIVYKKVVENLTQLTALRKEKELIRKIGRVVDNTGPLLNISRGGQQGGETCKPVVQYTLEGKKLKTYPSCLVASENVSSANRSYITQVCNGKRKSAGGFLWTYEGATVPSYNKKYFHSVQQCNLNNKLIATYRSLTEAQNKTGIELHNISECCRGNSKTAGGFIWKYY